MAARDGKAGAGGDDARARDVSGVDVLAQIDRRESWRADVADGGKAGIEGQFGVDYAGDGGVEGRVGEGQDFVVAVGAGGEVSMAVDEAGEDIVGREVEDRRTGGRHEACRLDRLDALVGDDERDVVQVMAGG